MIYEPRSHLNRPKLRPEKMDQRSKTEKHGYVPVNKRIEEMILAGKRLDISRLTYDVTDPNAADPEIDPTRRPGYDLADASMADNSLRGAVQAVKEAAQAKKKDKKGSQAASSDEPAPTAASAVVGGDSSAPKGAEGS